MEVNKIALLMLVVILAFGLNSCKDKCNDPADLDCENYNPCYGVEKTSAYFIVEESLGQHQIPHH